MTICVPTDGFARSQRIDLEIALEPSRTIVEESIFGNSRRKSTIANIHASRRYERAASINFSRSASVANATIIVEVFP